MALANLNLNPTERQLRQFGGICVLAIPAVAWFATHNTSIVGWCALGGVMLGGLSYVIPAVAKPLFVVLTIATFPIGLVVGELAMLLIYFAAFLPMALIFRVIGRDSLQRRSGPATGSLWQPRVQPKDAKSYYRQF